MHVKSDMVPKPSANLQGLLFLCILFFVFLEGITIEWPFKLLRHSSAYIKLALAFGGENKSPQ